MKDSSMIYSDTNTAANRLALALAAVLIAILANRNILAAPFLQDPNLRPVIGVFSQCTSTVTGSTTIDPTVKAELEKYQYRIPASYV